MEIIVEVCCGGYEDAVHAWDGGADRIELNSGLALGGLTPSVGTLRLIQESCPGFVTIAMVRPRGGGFCYSQAEYQAMLADAKALLDAGADGIAFGFLQRDEEAGTMQMNSRGDCGIGQDEHGIVDRVPHGYVIDAARTREMAALIHEYGRTAVFHRAFDIVGATDDAIQTLIDLGVDRVLTSGGMDTALHGTARIASLVQVYGEDIEIVAGSGVHAENVAEIIAQTGIMQVHSSCKEWIGDMSADTGEVSFSYDTSHVGMFDAVTDERVRALCDAVATWESSGGVTVAKI